MTPKLDSIATMVAFWILKSCLMWIKCPLYSSISTAINTMSTCHMVKQSKNVQVLCRMRLAIGHERTYFLVSNLWQLQYDSSPAHISLLFREFVANEIIVMTRQCILFLSQKPLKGRRFARIDELQNISIRGLKAIPRQTSKGHQGLDETPTLVRNIKWGPLYGR